MHTDTTAESGGSDRMIVEPDNLLRLKRGLEEDRLRIHDWLYDNRDRLRDIPPPGNDPCSQDTMHLMAQNAQQAIDACAAYVERLGVVVQKLGESAAAYGRVENDTTTTFRQGPA